MDGGLASESKLWNPRGIALDAAGNLQIADTFGSRVRRVDAALTSPGALPSFADGRIDPTDLLALAAQPLSFAPQ